MIIGLVYTLAIPNFESLKQPKEHVTLANLKNFLQKIPHEQSVALICTHECHECFIQSDNQRVQEYDNLFDNFLDSSVTLYSYDMAKGMYELEKRLFFKDENNYEEVCFSYAIDASNQGDELFIAYNNKVYDYASAFETKVYASLQEATEARQKYEMEVLQ
jgi:hypothetical protein